MASHTSDPNTREADMGELQVQGFPGYRARSCLKLPSSPPQESVYVRSLNLLKKKKSCLYFCDRVPEIDLLDQTV